MSCTYSDGGITLFETSNLSILRRTKVSNCLCALGGARLVAQLGDEFNDLVGFEILISVKFNLNFMWLILLSSYKRNRIILLQLGFYIDRKDKKENISNPTWLVRLKPYKLKWQMYDLWYPITHN